MTCTQIPTTDVTTITVALTSGGSDVVVDKDELFGGHAAKFEWTLDGIDPEGDLSGYTMPDNPDENEARRPHDIGFKGILELKTAKVTVPRASRACRGPDHE